MRPLNRLLLLLALLPCLALATPPGMQTMDSLPTQAPDRVLVKFSPDASAGAVNTVASQVNGRVINFIPQLGITVLQVPAGTVGNSVRMLAHNPNVVFAEPDFYRVLKLPDEGDDPEPTATNNYWFEQQWALNNTGQPLLNPETGVEDWAGVPDADIDAVEAWELTTGSPAVKIAILDTGVDCRTAARPGGSLEFISPGKCIEERSFVEAYSNTLDDVAAHGSHVAGIAAAATDNDIGIAGVGWDSAIGSLKTCYEYYYDLLPPLGYYVIVGICPVSSSIAAITYAADHGYHVINMSYNSDEVDESGEPLGLGGHSLAEEAAVDYAWDQGLLLVAAAGNNGNSVMTYPAGYEHVVAVGASTAVGDRAGFSSYGNWVSLLAPGETILATIPNSLCVFYAEILGIVFDPDGDACLDWYSGTSMASPHVAGAAALLWQALFAADLTDPSTCQAASGEPCNQVIRDRLELNADTTGPLGQNYLAWSQHGHLNAAAALANAAPPGPDPDPDPPSAPTVLSVTDNGDGTATITWDHSGEAVLQREKLHTKSGQWKSTTDVWSGTGITSYQDSCGAGTFRYRVGARQLDGTVLWGDWSAGQAITGGSGGGKGGGNKGGGGGKGKP